MKQKLPKIQKKKMDTKKRWLEEHLQMPFLHANSITKKRCFFCMVRLSRKIMFGKWIKIRYIYINLLYATWKSEIDWCIYIYGSISSWFCVIILPKSCARFWWSIWFFLLLRSISDYTFRFCIVLEAWPMLSFGYNQV